MPQNFFAAYTQVNLFCEIAKKNCFQFIERNPARRQSNNIYLLRLMKSIFSRKTDIQQKYSIVPYKIKLPATLVCTLISEILF